MDRDERMLSPAYRALRASARRLFKFIDREIARQGSPVTLFADEFAVVGSVRVVLPGLSELQGLGLLDVERRFRHRWQPQIVPAWGVVTPVGASDEVARSGAGQTSSKGGAALRSLRPLLRSNFVTTFSPTHTSSRAVAWRQFASCRRRITEYRLPPREAEVEARGKQPRAGIA